MLINKFCLRRKHYLSSLQQYENAQGRVYILSHNGSAVSIYTAVLHSLRSDGCVATIKEHSFRRRGGMIEEARIDPRVQMETLVECLPFTFYSSHPGRPSILYSSWEST